MPMNPRLLRPIASGVHPEANAWRTAVVANGGSVSASTMKAVSTFCAAIDAASIRDRFYRLNLFAGTGLNAAIVPLYRGPSRTGTQYGNTTDTNVGPFVSGDYSEATGLQGASGKYLNTGLLASTFDRSNTHVSIYGTSLTTAPGSFGSLIGARNASAGDIIQFDGKRSTASNAYFSHSTPASLSVAGSPVASSGHLMGVSRTSTDLQVYSNGASTGSQTGDRTTGALVNVAIFVFANNFNGSPTDISGMLCRQYSVGLGMTSGQASSYYTALQAFQTALGRNA
jgi:hypothetical protein